MESVISLPSASYPRVTQLSETLITMYDHSSGDNKNNGKLRDQSPEYFKRALMNMSFRGVRSSLQGSKRGLVRRSVRNFEMRLNGKPSEDSTPLTDDTDEGELKFEVDIPVKNKEDEQEAKEEITMTNDVQRKEEVSVQTEHMDIKCDSKNVDVAEFLMKLNTVDMKTGKSKKLLPKFEIASKGSSKSPVNLCTNMCTQTDASEFPGRKINLIPLASLKRSSSVPDGDENPDITSFNPMHVVTLNPKPTKKGKHGPTPPRVLKRRMSVSGDEQVEKFSRLTRFGSGLRKRLSESTRDLFGSSSSSTSSSSPPTTPKDDTNSITSTKLGFKRQMSSSMRDLFGGSFSSKSEKDIRDRFGKYEERRKDKTFRQSSFVIGGGITIGRSAGRSRSTLRDSFRKLLPKLRMSRVFEVNVVLPDGTETTVMGSDKDTIQHVLSPLISALRSAGPEAPPIQPKGVSKPSKPSQSPEVSSRPSSVSPDSLNCRSDGTASSSLLSGIAFAFNGNSTSDLDGDAKPDGKCDTDCRVGSPQRTGASRANTPDGVDKRELYERSLSSMDYQSLSGESEMSIAMKNSLDSLNERSDVSMTSPDMSPPVETSPLRSKSPLSSPQSLPPTPFTPSDLSTLLKQNITPAELSESSLELLKSLDLLKSTFSLIMKDCGAEVDMSFPGYLLDGDAVVLVEQKSTVPSQSGPVDPRRQHLERFVESERLYRGRLKTLEGLYGRPLRRMQEAVTEEECSSILGLVEPLIDASQEVTDKLSKALANWDSSSEVGDFFNCIWARYYDYLETAGPVKKLLLGKLSSDGELRELLRLHRGAAKYSALQLLQLPAERVSEYEQFFASLVVDTHPDHPDRPPLYRHHQTASNLVCARDASGGDGELERIQELFPHDSLRLHDPHPTTQKMKGLMRKRSTTAARLHRAFSAKGSRGQGPPDQPPPLQHANGYANGSLHNTSDFNTSYNGSSSVNSSTNTGYHDVSTECLSPGLNSTTSSNGTPYNNKQQQNYQHEATTPSAPRPKRHFIMETPVQFTTGVQSQERHLFLFSDLLLVAKSRSGGNFKLKEKVRVSEMWLASCLEDVAEVSKSHDTSFVMGWPTTNVVATFSCVQTKDLWYNKLAQVVAEEKEGSPPTNIQVSYTDSNTCVEICKTVSITVNTNARECISLILDHLEMRDVDVTKFQLWVKTPHDDSPYPLIGHEFPLSIKYNNLRDTAQESGTEHLNNIYNNGTDIKFVLRPDGKVGVNGSPTENGGKKVSKKARKSPIRNKLFKRSASKGDAVDGPATSPPGILFGHPLFKLAEANGGALPKPVMEMLTQLFQKGPFTEGIFRKSANARVVREIREKLDSGCPTDLSSTNITAVAALFKDFLRSLPDALLNCQLHDDWLDVPRLPTIRDQISRTLLLCSRLPRSNLLLLQHFLCVLHHITRRSKTNKMSASNLAVCVGPSVLWSTPPVLSFSAEVTKQHSSIVEFLIDRFGDIFGEAMLRLMGDPPEQDPARQDSGAEETDSMHSCNGRRDDSSIDSLERDLEGLSPLPRKDKMSLTNLSRDSGLTMSDTQLYTPDEEESESTSSGHSSGDKSMPYAEHRPVERVAHYPAPNNPNAIYTAVCRRPEKPLSSDEPENYYATPSREHTRVQITYSSPCNPSSNKDVGSHTYNQERLIDSQRMMYDSDGIYSVPNTDHQLQLQEIENMNSNFQRDDWMRRKSNLRKVCKTNSNEGGCLTRSTSEESLLSKCNNHEYGLSLSAGGPPPTLLCEERSRSPPSIEYDDSVGFLSRDSAIRRSRSAHYLAEVRREKLKDKSDEPSTIVRSSSQDSFSFLRSRSTPHIQDEGDRSYDSSTLSDDDSTPHVSRSNSRGKECGSTGAPSWDATLTPSDSGNSRNSSFKSERTGSICTVVSAGSCSTLASNPPSYEEALNRRSIMQQQNQRTGTPPQFTEYAIREEKLKAARAKQLYADSLKQYQETSYPAGDIVRASPAHTHDGDDTDSPPPLPPKGDPPPLPPKQRASRRGMNDSASRLKHHPPVHVETQSRKQKLSSTPSPQSSGFGQTMHKTIIYTDVGPPNLPPKERTVIEVVESTTESDRVRQQTVRTVSPRQTVEKKSIETQTDECDLGDSDDLRDGDSQTSDSWLSDHITSVHVPDSSFNYGNQNNSSSSQNRNNVSSGNNTSINNSDSHSNQKRSRGRPRRRDSSASQRSRSVPSRDSVTVMHSASDSEDDEYLEYQEYHSSNAAINYGLRDFRNFDSELRHELTWSVSQLRARFGESHKGAKVHPPPYRPPPNNRAPITSYHLGAGDTFCRKTTPSRPQSTYGEESYV